jgi:hypothetical protein
MFYFSGRVEMADFIVGSPARDDDFCFREQFIDELPDMLNSMCNASREEHETFLHWFRKIRDRSLRHNLRWLVGGSVNLIAALDQQARQKGQRPQVRTPASIYR